MKRIRIALVWDFDEKMYTHTALNKSIEHCRPQLPFELEAEWIPAEQSERFLSVPSNFNCNFGVNPLFHEKLNKFSDGFTAFSPTGEVRAFELHGHRFFKGTLFQPTLDSSPESPNPLIVSFFKAYA